MHQRKRELLANLDESSRSFDVALRQVVDIVRQPDVYGLWGSFGAGALGLPLLGFGAVMLDVAAVLVARSSDAEWERVFPGEDGGDGGA